MFCKVSLTDTSSYQNLAIEFLECVNSVATANAGFTPTHSTATIEVISNAEAGGWTQGTATSMASGSGHLPHLTLLTDSGKTSKPNTFISFVAPNSGNTTRFIWTTFGFMTSDTYPDYSASNSDQGLYIQGAGHSSSLTSSNLGDHIAESLFACDLTATRIPEFYIACNSEFIHIQHSGVSDYFAGAWFHWGKRTHQSWEDQFNDNPYWVALWDHGYDMNNAATNGYWTSMRVLEPVDGTYSGPHEVSRFVDWGPREYLQNATGNWAYHPLTGYRHRNYLNEYVNNNYVSLEIHTGYTTGIPTQAGTTYWMNSPTGVWNTVDAYTPAEYTAKMGTYALSAPIHTLYQENGYQQNGLTYDTSTSSVIPSATPMRIQLVDGLNAGGVMKYLLQGVKLSSHTYYPNYCTTGATVNIDGDDYVLTQFMTTGAGEPPNFNANLYVKKV